MKKIQLILWLFSFTAFSYAQDIIPGAGYNAEIPMLSVASDAARLDSVCVYKNSGCWSPYSKEKYTYTNGKLTQLLTLNANLQPYTSDSYEYNGQGLGVKKIRGINLNTTPHFNYFIYEYDANQNQILEVLTDTLSLTSIRVNRDSIHFENGLKVYRQISTYFNGVFSNPATYYEWQYDANKKPLQLSVGSITNSIKTYSNREEYVYVNNNLISTTFSSWNTTLLDWAFTNKYVYDYNSNNKMSKKEYYTYVNAAWKLSYAYEYAYDSYSTPAKTTYFKPSENGSSLIPLYQDVYNSGKNTLSIETNRFYWTFYGWKHYLKTVYFYNEAQQLQTNWQDLCGNGKTVLSVNVAGCPEMSPLKLKENDGISVYPNPSQGEFDVVFKNKPNGKYKINIYSVSGKLINSSEVKVYGVDFIKPVNLNSNKGIIFVQVISDNEVFIEKILVQP